MIITKCFFYNKNYKIIKKMIYNINNYKKHIYNNFIYKKKYFKNIINNIFPIIINNKIIITIIKNNIKKYKNTNLIKIKILININIFNKNNIIKSNIKKINLLNIPLIKNSGIFNINNINKIIIYKLTTKYGISVINNNTMILLPSKGLKITFKKLKKSIKIYIKNNSCYLNIFTRSLGISNIEYILNNIQYKYLYLFNDIYINDNNSNIKIKYNDKYIKVKKYNINKTIIAAETIKINNINILKNTIIKKNIIEQIINSNKRIIIYKNIKKIKINNKSENINISINNAREYIINKIIYNYYTKKKNNINIVFYNKFLNSNKYILNKTIKYDFKNIIKIKNNNILINKTILIKIINYLNQNKKFLIKDYIYNKKIIYINYIIKKIIINNIYNIVKIITKKCFNIKKYKNKIINNLIKEFFYISPLSQFAEQLNPLTEITHQRKITLIGSKGITNKNQSIKIRKINISNYNKICPIETPEGNDIGLINTLSILTKIDNNGLFNIPYYKINKYKKINKIKYIKHINENNKIIGCNNKNYNYYYARYNNKIINIKKRNFNLIELCNIQLFSISTLMVPFIEYNDANRVLMGSNMMKQALPCNNIDIPYIRTGIENILTHNININNPKHKIIFIDCKNIIITIKINNILCIINKKLIKFKASNQSSIINYNIKNNKKILFESNFYKNGILCLGQNLITALMTWEGYNFEDSIIISKKIINNNIYTSYHINNIETEFNNKNNIYIKKNIFKINKCNKKKLNKYGIIKIGSYIKPGDILICKIKKKTKHNKQNILINKIFNKNTHIYKKNFIKVPNGINGKITKIIIINKNNIKNEINSNILHNKYKFIYNKINKNFIKKLKKNNIKYTINNKNIIFKNYNYINIKYKKIILINRINYFKNKYNNKKNIYNNKINIKNIKKIIIEITSIKKLNIGDKMSGRYGNKGVISKILNEEDMPYLNDGTICEILFNPIGVPSRMNIGQLYEITLGLLILITNKILTKKRKTKYNKINIKTIPFEGINNNIINKMFNKVINNKIKKIYKINIKTKKIIVYNGINGYKYHNKITVGYMYILKLNHLSIDKIHARSIGPYSLINNQPLKGKSNKGGQRIGEMEVWALEAYGTAYTLYELLTIKSDAIIGRNIIYNNILNGINQIILDIPESFKNLINELKALCINIITL